MRAPALLVAGLLLLPLMPALGAPAPHATLIVRHAPDVAPDALAVAHGAVVLDRIPAFDAALVAGTEAALARLAQDPRVLHAQANAPRALHLATATVASRAAEAWALDAGQLDGRGVGIAVVDTGIDATHPDLPLGAKVVRNFRWAGVPVPALPTTPPTPAGPVVFVEAPNTDLTSGHGTHVAGIAAGTGAASGGALRGAAPGASLYGFGVGEGRNVLVWPALKAFEWVILHGAAATPPIRVVTNSWGGPHGLAYDPDDIVSVGVRALVDAGFVVVFAAGNGGAHFAFDRTTPECKDPTPGVLCVAAYADAETGTTEGAIHVSSSRGAPATPRTWPDLAAPGAAISAPAATAGIMFGERPAAQPPRYISLTGTSMAAPHVAGAAALVLAARPDLTPAEVEGLLKTTAQSFAAEAPLPSRAAGAGLLDARAAVEAALGLPASPSAAPDENGNRLVARLAVPAGPLAIDAGEAGRLSTAFARHYGVAADLDTRVLPAVPARLSVRATYEDAGTSFLSVAALEARLDFLGSGRSVAVPMAPDGPGAYAGGSVDYEPADGDVLVTVTADRTRDGPTADDNVVVVRYRRAP